MINANMDTRRYKRRAKKEDKERSDRARLRPNYEYRNDPDYLRPQGKCHCDNCVSDRYAGDSR